MKKKICYVLLTLLILFNIYDTYSTNVLLNSGTGFYEANPILRFFMGKLGQVPGMVALKALGICWFMALLLRARTERMWNMILVGLLICAIWYGAGMYFLNYKSMLFLEGML
jgi:hypothetical protein